MDDLVGGAVAHLPLAAGIKVCALHAGKRAGLALHIAREAVRAGQLQRMLVRRFEQALVFDGHYLFTDAKGDLVIWHALPTRDDTLDKILSRMLSLADLEALDPRP